MDLGGGGGGGGGSAYERGLDNYGDEAYRRSHSQPHTSSGLGHYSSHASPYERDTYSADPYRSGHGGLSGGYTSGFDRSDPYDTIGASPRDYSSGGHLGSGGGDLYGAGGSGLPPAIDIDRNYSMSEPPGSRIRDIGYGADHLHSDPLSHSRHDSLGLDGFGLSSPLTGHSPSSCFFIERFLI